jgi:hypothetical protein
MKKSISASAVFLFLAAQAALAQGGPPMVTDDPETPGNGKWEINLGALGTHTRTRKEINFPDADINYGLGDRIQLKMDVPWTFVKETGESWKSGLGTSSIGLKWRFIDGGEDGFSVSTYPQYVSAWSASSKDRGVASREREFFLPVELARKVGEWTFDGEAGRNFVRGGDSEWIVGGIVAHKCGGEAGECLLEVRDRFASHDTQTLVNLGLRWKLSEHSTLLASAGREFGPHTDERQDFVFYLGVQLVP